MNNFDTLKNTNESLDVNVSQESIALSELESDMIRENFYTSIE
jgi:hypothetical protein